MRTKDRWDPDPVFISKEPFGHAHFAVSFRRYDNGAQVGQQVVADRVDKRDHGFASITADQLAIYRYVYEE